MTNRYSLLTSKKAYIVYSIIAAIFFAMFWHSESLNQVEQDWLTRFNLKQKENDELLLKAERLQKRLDTVNDFLDQINIKKIMEKNENQTHLIEELQDSLLVFQNKNTELQTKLTEMEQSYANQASSWQAKNKDLEASYKRQVSDLEEKLSALQSETPEEASIPKEVDFSAYYEANGKSISDLVARMKFLKYFCENYSQSMVAKKSEYKLLITDLKQRLPEDPYIRKLNLVKVYTSSPMLATLRDKYTSKDVDLESYTDESNDRIATQLGHILNYIQMTYA